MRHPASEVGPRRICPTTGTQFDNAWSNHSKPGCYNECDQCFPDESKSISQKLKELSNSRKNNDD